MPPENNNNGKITIINIPNFVGDAWFKNLVDDIDWDVLFGGNPNKQVTPERAPSLTNNQSGI